jgi:hypothetical protein
MSKQDSVTAAIQPYKVIPDDVFIQFIRIDQDADKVVLYNVIICQNGISNDEGQEYFTFVHILIEDFEAFVIERFCEVDYLSRVGYEDDQHIKVDFADWWAGQEIDVLKKYCQKYIAERKEIETGTEFTGLSPY